ncbi:LuxR family transcriptional regulator [Actinoplanes lobatus]|uniref:DNA-binding CsgD family transcriptional regulator n=1 Tax=Actinoplanes lobatus TaxID=113568 RepID=A0A7W7HMJ0_9ACTN|nr:helix-turn-helix transcriptional regulator [Actinoplanes lobatus]MBB4753206.1 DNA-binding CsgD family transcriptional regulator [Actinoplanes lobatus]GGN59117.1 LuxR family transcriptional regulator [Actinoplanes lobatus]GIE42934.1 LuxR family transcriptional regulator [Actinoplanes lobatus]
MILGRRAELDTVAALLHKAADGGGGALVIRGEAGIGKSALLEHAVQRAAERGMRVLATAGVQAEVRIPYAGLHRLLRGAPDLADTVLNAPDTPPVRAAMILLGLLGEAPALVAVEDAQWLDEPSWAALAFVARRLAGAGLTELPLEPLGEQDSRDLLDRVAPELGAALATRVLAEAAGNPLGLVELGRAAARSGGAALLPSAIPLSTRVERTFTALVDELPPATRTLLLVAALNDGDDLDETVAAARRLHDGDLGPDDVEPAVATRLIRVDSRFRVRFRHPLLRSALQQAAPVLRRRRGHAALAGVVTDPERRTWHRAAGAPGPDEDLARELTEIAVRASERQAAGIAMAAFDQAVRLSANPQARGHRQLRTADLAVQQGDLPTAVRLFGEIREEDLSLGDQALLGLFREVVQGTGWTGEGRLSTFAEAVERMCRDGEAEAAVDVLAAISLRAYWSYPDPHLIERLLAAVENTPEPVSEVPLLLVQALLAPQDRAETCLRRLTAAAEIDQPAGDGHQLGMAAAAISACDLAVAFFTAAEVGLREQGRLAVLAQVLISHAMVAGNLGDVWTTLNAGAEGRRLAAEISPGGWVPTALLANGLAEALRGGEAEALRLADQAETMLLPAGRTPLLALVRQVRGVTALGAGRADEAFRELRRVFDPADVSYHPHTRPLLVAHLAEAAAGCGARAELRAIVDGLPDGPSPALAHGLGYARAVLADTDVAYQKALADDLTGWPFERARRQHAYGAWLRRRRRPADSRPLLRAAAAAFDALGATAWADRSRAELRASGETLRRPSAAERHLTPQETQIARLAADGLSNRDIAERLFLSPRTVTTHLSRIYPKLGIKSRAELARALA